jgi:hypothetical protein
MSGRQQIFRRLGACLPGPSKGLQQRLSASLVEGEAPTANRVPSKSGKKKSCICATLATTARSPASFFCCGACGVASNQRQVISAASCFLYLYEGGALGLILSLSLSLPHTRATLSPHHVQNNRPRIRITITPVPYHFHLDSATQKTASGRAEQRGVVGLWPYFFEASLCRSKCVTSMRGAVRSPGPARLRFMPGKGGGEGGGRERERNLLLVVVVVL